MRPRRSAGLPDRRDPPEVAERPRGRDGAHAASDAAASRRPVRKLAGVLGETDGLGTADPRVVIGIGINADWAADDFPPELAAR